MWWPIALPPVALIALLPLLAFAAAGCANAPEGPRASDDPAYRAQMRAMRP